MTRTCGYCDSRIPEGLSACAVCGAQPGKRPSDYLPGVFSVLGGGGCFLFALFCFSVEYPPGTKVTAWSRPGSGGGYYSTNLTIALTTGLPLLLGLLIVVVDLALYVKHRRSRGAV